MYQKTLTIYCLYPGLTLSVISGSLGQLIAERGRLSEDLSLHYHSQVLTALEYLVKKKVVHLDIKGTLYRDVLLFHKFVLVKLMLMYLKVAKVHTLCTQVEVKKDPSKNTDSASLLK